MDKYIRQILDQEGRVTISGFGTFIKNNEDNTILFNSGLSQDHGGQLKALIAQQENISETDAEQKISDFSQKANETLNNNGTLSIGGIGEITLVDGLYNLNITPDATSIPEPCACNTEESPENVNAVDLSTSVADTETEETEEKSNSKRNIIIIALIILLFLICSALCLLVFNKDNIVYNYFFGNNTEVVQAPAEQPKQVEEPIVEEPQEPQAEQPKQATTRTKRYNIIVGTYNNEAAAANRVKQLIDKGFKDAFVGTFKDHYVAIIESYDDIRQAEARQEYIVDTYRIESYMTNSGDR